MANDQSFKVKNGILAQRYLQTAGTETAGADYYSLAGATYDSVSFSVVAQEAFPYGLFFRPDGLKMYVVGRDGDDVNEYDLSTAWDVSTASYLQVFSVASQDSAPVDVFFRPDGLKMYVVGFAGQDINEYNLSTAWNISTASYLQNFSVSAQETQPFAVFFRPDGLKMYVIGTTGAAIYEYNLSTAWNISTASYLQNFSVSAQETQPFAVFFRPDGLKMYVIGTTGDAIYEYNLSTAWNISTASYVRSFSLSAQDGNPTSVFFKPDGTKMYISGSNTDRVYQYSTVNSTQTLDLSTGTYFSLTPSGTTTVSFTNPPASGVAIAFALEINGNGSAITWPASVKWHRSVAPTVTSTKELYTFITVDGGTTYFGKQAATGIA